MPLSYLMGRKRIKEFAFLDQLDKPKQNQTNQFNYLYKAVNLMRWLHLIITRLLSDNGGY